MHLNEYKKNLKKSLRPRTLTFFVKDNKIMLGYKKRGFGKGNFLGIGGKVEPGESIEVAARREILEEVEVTAKSLQQKATLNFYFPHIEDESWNQQVHAFILREWEGEPQETEEIRPQWFELSQIPYSKMWNDAHFWLPLILEGKVVAADFLFDENLKVIASNIS